MKSSRIEQVWHPYWLWEDAMMYHPALPDVNGEDRTKKVIELLGDTDHFYRVAKWMMLAFPYACEHNLTNPAMNRIAYIGQASCFYAYGITEEEVRKAWRFLSEEQRNEANETAGKALEEWENEYIKNHA